MNTSELSETERARIRGQFAQVPFARLLDLQLHHVSRSATTLHINVRDELKQYKGLLRGGVIASLIDTAATAFAALTTLEEPEQAATIDSTIHYLRLVTNG